MNFIHRTIYRILIFLSGATVVFLAVTELVPLLDSQIPLIFALFIVYGFVAYIFLPATYRMIKLVVRPTVIPHYTYTADGFRCDPVNLAFVGTYAQVKNAFQKIGWCEPDKLTMRSIYKMFHAQFTGQKYLSAPFIPLFLFGRKQDIGFQKYLTDEKKFARHHIRLWSMPEFHDTKRAWLEQLEFWADHLIRHRKEGRLWVAAATSELGHSIMKFQGKIAHKNLPDVNATRDFIVEQLTQNNLVKTVKKVQATEALDDNNAVFGTKIVTDGYIKLIYLKKT